MLLRKVSESLNLEQVHNRFRFEISSSINSGGFKAKENKNGRFCFNFSFQHTKHFEFQPKHKFDKKKAVTFQLVHRSQQDPLIADENAPQHVLLPVEGKKEKRLEEQHKFGIYYDDDCNYLEHLKDVSDNRMEWPEHVEGTINERIERTKAQLPESVFPSVQEEEVGMLAKAAPVYGPQLHLDPDLVAAMDDDFDYSDPENQLEDNFIDLAEGVASDQEIDGDDQSNFGSEEMDEVGSLDGSDQSFSREETRSKFTTYSMTSSVMRRNDQLSLLDEKFEKVLNSIFKLQVYFQNVNDEFIVFMD